MINPHINADVVEAQEFTDMVQHYRVMGVPKTVINDAAEFVGAVPDEYFVNIILQALGKPEHEFTALQQQGPDEAQGSAL
jgi:predicted DsbA family dithiol-disulfide isomerase